MTEEQFYNTTPRTFSNILEGYNRQIQKEEFEYRLDMEKHRELVYVSILPYLKEKDRKPVKDFMPFPWDKGEQQKEKRSSFEVFKDIDERLAKVKEVENKEDGS